MQQVSGQQLGQALFDLGPALPHEFPIPLPRVVARQLKATLGQFPFPAAGIFPLPAVQPAQAPPGLPPQPRAVAPPPPPAPVTSIHCPVAERRGM